jgi:hypothetical protein
MFLGEKTACSVKLGYKFIPYLKINPRKTIPPAKGAREIITGPTMGIKGFSCKTLPPVFENNLKDFTLAKVIVQAIICMISWSTTPGKRKI